jgi:protein ImuB
MFACLCASTTSPSTDVPAVQALLAAAREFSPRVEAAGSRTVVADLTGVERLFGDPHVIANELQREAASRGVPARVAVAGSRTAALLLAHARPGVSVIAPGAEASAVAGLPVRALDALLPLATDRLEAGPMTVSRFYRTSPMEELARHRSASVRHAIRTSPRAATRAVIERHERLLATLERWGLRTLGDLAALPAAELAARLGADGPSWQRIARGEDDEPLVPCLPEERFEEHLDLEWPIEGLEPLSFVLGRLLEPLSAHLERRDRAAATLIVALRLVSRETFTRRLQLPAPIRDARVLRTLALLDLEAHPPGAGIDAVTVRVEPTPGRVLQHSLLERARPAPEQVSTLLARLSALMGDGRCGSPAVPDSYRPGAFTLEAFVADESTTAGHSRRSSRKSSVAPASADVGTPAGSQPDEREAAGSRRTCVLRRYRHPVPIRVAIENGAPHRVIADRPGVSSGTIEACVGPWHTSGAWWADGWNRDEWEVALVDGSVCRIFQDRDTCAWFMDAVID